MNHILRRAIEKDNWVIGLLIKKQNGESLTEDERNRFFHDFIGKHFGEDAVCDGRQRDEITENLCLEIAAIGKEISSRKVNITF